MNSIKFRRAIITSSILAAAITMPEASSAQIMAEVRLTKQNDNLYKVDGGTIWLRTHFCKTEAKNTPAFLITVGSGNNIIDFADTRESVDLQTMYADQKTRCAIRQVFKEFSAEPAVYDVNIISIETNFYTIDLLGQMAVRTSDCSIYAPGSEKAELEVYEDGTGLLVFPDRKKTCAVTAFVEAGRL